MNRKEFYEATIDLDTPLTWCIITEESRSKWHQGEIGFDDVVLDLNAPEGVPDGVYDYVDTTYAYCGVVKRVKGITVKDGKFEVRPTIMAIWKAIDHCSRKVNGFSRSMPGVEYIEKKYCSKGLHNIVFNGAYGT